MRKILLSLAAAGIALAATSPAVAQYYPQSYGYGSNGYGYNGFGYNGYGDIRALQARINAVQRQIDRLDRNNRIGDGTANRLREESGTIEHRLYRAQRYGLNPYEANSLQTRIARLEQRVQYAAPNRYGRYGYSRDDGYYGDRDRGRDYDRDDD